MRHLLAWITFAWLFGHSIAAASPNAIKFPSPNPATLLSPASTDALAGALRGYFVKNAPPVLYEGDSGWGRTKQVVNGVKWTGGAIPIHPHVQFANKNDGDWRKFRVAAPKLADTLVFDIRSLHYPESGKLTFDLYVAFDAVVEYEHQKWDAGIRLFSTSARARLRAKATINCEVTTRLEKTGSLLPDAVFSLHVTAAKVAYDNLVVEHVAGIGGEAAKVIGDTVKGGLKKWNPSLESELLHKGDAALVKAGNLKEVRISLASLFQAKNGKK
jgi:hypothetical protein